MGKNLICVLLIVSVLSENITFRNVTIEYDVADYYYQSFVNIDATNNLKDKLGEENVSRITVLGVVPIVYEDAISNLPKLKILQLQRIQIEEVKPGAFKNVPLLEILRLNENKIKKIEDGVFNNLNLVFLNLEHNNIGAISPKAFDDLPKLKVLTLDDNKLMEIYPQWLESKPFLSSASFMYNQIETLPRGLLANYHNDIFLSNNRIRNVSSNIFGNNKKSLGQFWLNFNEIEQWNEDFLQGAEIRIFDISNNRLECLDGNLDNFFVAFKTRCDNNPWNCDCLKKIEIWKQGIKQGRVEMKSINKCN